jgi:hypothetical protein
VAAIWNVDKVWQRSRVTNVDETNSMYDVFHVDLGHSGCVGLAEIRRIDVEYCSLPELVIPCTLENLQQDQTEMVLRHIFHCTNVNGMLEGQVKAIRDGVVVMDIPAVNIRMGMNEVTG